MDTPGCSKSLSDPQDDETQNTEVKSTRASLESKNCWAATFPNAEVSVIPLASTSELLEEDGKGVLGEMPPSVNAYRWSDCFISYQSPVHIEAPLIRRPLLNHIYANQDDIKSMACPPRKNSTASEHADGSTESAQISASNKMQVQKPTGQEDDQRCSCKKSNCLKLYCGCFASASYCTESCQCQDCYNRHEEEEIVDEMKDLIKSRTPHAFAPKIIQPVTIVPQIRGDGRNMITTSGRHRVGCNCRKSLCMKNYCECFKALVGCSSMCRCKDCKNYFGVRKASAEIGEMDGESETVKVKSAMTRPEQCHTGFSPLNPSIESSIRNVANPSAASGLSVLSSCTDSGNSPVDSSGRTGLPTAGQGTPTFSSNYQASSSYDAENFDSFLRLCDNFTGEIIFSSSPNSEFFAADSLPPAGESINELELDSSSGLRDNLEHNDEILKDSSSPIEAVKTCSTKQEPSSPSDRKQSGM